MSEVTSQSVEDTANSDSTMTSLSSAKKVGQPVFDAIHLYQTKGISLDERESQIRNLLQLGVTSADPMLDSSFSSESSYFNGLGLPVRAIDVRKRWEEFLSIHVPKGDWMALCKEEGGEDDRTTKCVDVISVDFDSLTARVAVITLNIGAKSEATMIDTSDGDGDGGAEGDEVSDEEFSVSLIDLHVIDEGEGNVKHEEAGLALEHFRFFYRNIWKPWDERSEVEDWVGEHLANRFALHREVSLGGKTSEIAAVLRSLEHRYKESLAKLMDMEETESMQDGKEGAADEDEEYLAKLGEIEEQLDEIEHQAHQLEDVELRESRHCRDLKKIREKRANGGKVSAMVYEKGTFADLQKVLARATEVLSAEENFGDNTVELFTSIDDAVGNVLMGDVLILPKGDYNCISLKELKHGGTIFGLGESEEDTVIFCNVEYPDEILKNIRLVNVKLAFSQSIF